MTQAGGWSSLVVGIGNPERGDDGVGAEVARLVDARRLAGVHVKHYREPVSLLSESLDQDIVVVVDAVVGGGAAGTVTVRDVNDSPFVHTSLSGGTHAMGLGTVVELARTLGQLPRRLVVVGVEGLAFEVGAGLSTPVRDSLEQVADAVAALAQGHS